MGREHWLCASVYAGNSAKRNFNCIPDLMDFQPRVPCLLAVDPSDEDISAALNDANQLGFTHILVADGDWPHGLGPISDAMPFTGLGLWVDLRVNRKGSSGLSAQLSLSHPIDPHAMTPADARAPDVSSPDLVDDHINGFIEAGVTGFVTSSRRQARQLRAQVAQTAKTHIAIALDARSTSSADHCADADYVIASAGGDLNQADFLDHLLSIPSIVELGHSGNNYTATALAKDMQIAAAVASGLILPHALLKSGACSDDEIQAIRAINHLNATEPALGSKFCWSRLSGAGMEYWAALRGEGHDLRSAKRGVLVVVNLGATEIQFPNETFWPRAFAEFSPLSNLTGPHKPDAPLDPFEVRLVSLVRPALMRTTRQSMPARAAAAAPRVVIGNMSPSVDGGRYSIKRVAGDSLSVEADIFGDGHESLAAELVLKAEDEVTPRRVRMKAVSNDRWQAELPLTKIGRSSFWIEAWYDLWANYHHELETKWKAGIPVDLEIREGIALIEETRAATSGRTARILGDHISRLTGQTGAHAVELLLDSALSQLMMDADRRAFLTTGFVQNVEVERLQARFASWYELFPRSQTDDASRPGTFRDVIARLPAIRDMGFDVLYFTPIHPIGLSNRKGPNNSVTAKPGEPGSPYAVGSPDGGHDAIHPELGTLDDFHDLRDAARDHGLELALDFAIQCSPDHPWLKQHPEWFDWRPDGTIKYAENPPKKYQDIVNVDFYAPGAIPDLWMALRRIVLFWVEQGVKTFRVDNPHTKPLQFWEWMINDVRAQHPDVLFLSEAFTRPKVMYHLAKVGFSQSYTYFTWRNAKWELMEYLTELNVTDVRDYFRPHFFVNTPDINPFFLQTSGRAGFLIRAALATMLSGLWGMYSGFELCEAEPLPGKEEYKDSEKFEIRPRNWNAPGNIVADITRLNKIRKSEPALQTHLGLTFYNAFNKNILYFGKALAGEREKVLVAVLLDPHRAHEADIEVPLWEWGLPDQSETQVIDLVQDHRFTWYGKTQHIRLTPDAPYAIWKVGPQRTN